MKKKTTKIIASALAIGAIMTMNPIGANADYRDGNKIYVNNLSSVQAQSEQWTYRDGYWMCADSDYHQAWNARWIETNGKWYYVDEDAHMLTNTWIIDTSDNWYYVGGDGAWTQKKLTLDDAVNLIKNNRTAYDWVEADKIDIGHFVEEIDSNSTDFKIGSTNVFDVIGHDENLYEFNFGVLSIYIGTTSGKVYISTGGSGVVTFSLVERGQEVKTWTRTREAELDGNGKQIGWNYDTPLELCTMNY